MNRIYTIGHSTRQFDDFLTLLHAYNIEILIDVRRFPGSKRHPQFNEGNMAQGLPDAGIEYRHEDRLGGRRGNPGKNSPNGGWQSDGFQAYADHLLSDTGQTAISELMRVAQSKITAIMCAEAVHWRCHRQIISDHLVASGFQVVHIIGSGQTEEHELRNMAQITNESTVIYPPQGKQEELFDE